MIVVVGFVKRVWWNGLNWSELDDEKELGWWVVEMVVLIHLGSEPEDGCILAGKFLLSLVERLEMGVVRQNRSVILHKWGSLWRSNFEGPDCWRSPAAFLVLSIPVPCGEDGIKRPI